MLPLLRDQLAIEPVLSGADIACDGVSFTTLLSRDTTTPCRFSSICSMVRFSRSICLWNTIVSADSVRQAWHLRVLQMLLLQLLPELVHELLANLLLVGRCLHTSVNPLL